MNCAKPREHGWLCSALLKHEAGFESLAGYTTGCSNKQMNNYYETNMNESSVVLL